MPLLSQCNKTKIITFKDVYNNNNLTTAELQSFNLLDLEVKVCSSLYLCESVYVSKEQT